MRISTMMMFNNLIRNLAKGTERTQELQQILSTGKKINRLSDDPIGNLRVINYQSNLDKLSQYKENIRHGKSWLDMNDSILQDIQNLVSEARNIAIAQSTSTVSRESRVQAAVEVQNLYEQLLNYANSKLGGNYIFGGSITNHAPFNPDGTYNGNGDDFTIEISEGIKSKINLAGSEFLITDLNPALSTAVETSGSTSSNGLVARNINTIIANPSGLSEYKVTFVLTNGLTQAATYTTDNSPTQDELGTGIADTVNNHETLNQYIRASYDATAGNIIFEAKQGGEGGNEYAIDEANTSALEGTVVTSFAGGRSEITSGFVFNNTNSDIVFEENLSGFDITANIIDDGGALSGQVYTGDQVASFIERAMETTSGLGYTYTVSYNESTNKFTITNDNGNGGDIELKLGMTAAETLGIDPLAFPITILEGNSYESVNEVEFNVLNSVNDEFRITVDGTACASDIDIAAGVYTSGTLATEIANKINADANIAPLPDVSVDFGVTISKQFTITSGTTGTNSIIKLTGDATNDFLRTVGLDRDLEVSGTSPTLLADLNGGDGVAPGDITITDRSGNNPPVTITLNDSDGDGIADGTILDVINNINAAGINVTAQLNSEGSGITLIDTSTFPIQNLVVADTPTARNLGIVGNKPGNIYGTDLNPAVTEDTRISALNRGTGLSLSAIEIVNGLKNEKIDLSRAESITDILTAINDLGIDVTASINSSRTALNVNSTTPDSAAVVCEVDEGTTVSDLGVQGASDFLKTLAVLQEALEKNDRFALLNMLDQFDLILDRLVEKASDVGVRSNQFDAMNNRIVTSEIEISGLKSDIEDADMVEYLTKFALQQTALEAMMSVAAQSVQISLLNFLK